jgi:NitT/TauT family transport system substrate-binding protein
MIRPPRATLAKRWAVFAMLCLTACGPAAPTSTVTLRSGVFATQDFLPYFVMQEEGFARANGLRFEEASFAGGAAALEAMIAGSLDVCASVGPAPLLSAAGRGHVPDTIMAVAAGGFADRDHPAVGVVVSRSVTTWGDLRGAQIATNARDSIVSASVAARLKREGVADYSFVEIPFSNMGLAVAGGNVAAAGMYEPFLTQSLVRGDGKLLDWVIGGPPFERSQVGAVVVRTDLYRNNPSAVKAFLRAHLQAVVWMERHPDRARVILTRRLGLTKELGARMKLLRWSADMRMDSGALEQIQDVLVDLGTLKAPVTVGRLYDTALLDDVLAERK